MFVYQSRFLTRGEVWFDDALKPRSVDWVLYWQRSRPVPHSRWRIFHTRLIDLSKSPGRLLAEMKQTTVTKIQEAAEKDRTRLEHRDSKDRQTMEEFESMWNQFAAARDSAPLDRRWLAPMIQAGALDLTAAKNPKGDLLALQATFLHCQRARQLMVVSPFRSNPDIATRKGIHRANCLLHWDAMLRMKEQGIRYFDFGGWYPGKTDITLLGMNAFKEGFGGTVARDYQCQKILTAKGWVVLTVARMLGKTKWPNANGEPDSEFKPDENPKEGKLSPAL